MITKEDLADCMALAVAVYPNHQFERPQLAAYWELLRDLDISKADLFNAIKKVIQTSSFFPTVAQIREAAKPTSTPTPAPFNRLEVENPLAVDAKPRIAAIKALLGGFGELPE